MRSAVQSPDDGETRGSTLGPLTRLLLGGGILLATALFVGLVLDWRRVLAVIVDADPWLLTAAVGASLVGLAGWSEALRRLLPSDARAVTRRRGFLVYATGGLVRNVLPVGYASSIAVLAYVYRREASLSLHRSLASVTVAELLVAIASSGVAAAGLFLLVVAGPATPLARWLALGALSLVGVGALIVVLAWSRRETVRRTSHTIAGLVAGAGNRLTPGFGERLSLAAVKEPIAEYVRALSTVSARRRDVGIAAGYATFGWLALVAAMYASGLAVGYRVPIAVAMFVVPIGGYATVLPLPGGLGGYELGVAAALHLLGGIGLEAALAVTLLFRVCSYWAVIAVGAAASSYLSVDVRHLASTTVGGNRTEAGRSQGSVDR